MGNTVDYEENTYKQYYFPTSDDEDTSPYPIKRDRPNNESLDEFFEEPPKKKKPKIQSSTVGRATKDGMAYISTNEDDGSTATHLIKIEIYEMKKLTNVPQSDHWKHADVRVKYYVNNKSKHHQRTRQLIYNISKDITKVPDCKKYTFKNKD